MAMKHPERGEDVTPPKEATPVEVRRFSDEAKAALEEDGYIIITLTGQSIASFREAGRTFWRGDWHKDNPQFEALTSMQSEVAINPYKLFLPKSFNKTVPQQKRMISNFSQRLAKKIPGVEAIMGGVPDYVDLAFTYRDTTGDYLVDLASTHFEIRGHARHSYNFARTNTPTSTERVASVGPFNSVSSLDVPLAWFSRP